ncbi:MAG: hypothetical protein DCC52_18120 [Chloroflexi bacterium]|nr:MAG: hypothetical protein DCC52_18120 [Chloroflexota bacterium]
MSLFNHLFEIQADDNGADAYEKIKTKLNELSMNGEENAPFVATMLGVELAGEDLERVRYLMPPFLRGRITQAVAQIFGALAMQEPTVMLEMLSQLLPLVENAPVMFLFLLRPNKTDPAWNFYASLSMFDASRLTTIELQPLDAHAARELVANLLEIEDLPESVRALILQKAEGNPFYVEEVIRSLLGRTLARHARNCQHRHSRHARGRHHRAFGQVGRRSETHGANRFRTRARI